MKGEKERVADPAVFSRPVGHESQRRIASILTVRLRGTGGDTACGLDARFHTIMQGRQSLQKLLLTQRKHFRTDIHSGT